MNWKESVKFFFKPTKLKTILYVLMVLIYPALTPFPVIFYGSFWLGLIGNMLCWEIVSCVIGIIIEKAWERVKK